MDHDQLLLPDYKPTPEDLDEFADKMFRYAKTPQDRKTVLDKVAQVVKAGKWPKTARGRASLTRFLDQTAADGLDVQGLKSLINS